MGGIFDANIATWQCTHTLTEHSGGVTSVAISPDGKILANCRNNFHACQIYETIQNHH
jgi:WD40 repeat protein